MIELEMPPDGNVVANINGKTVEYPLCDLIQGCRAGYIGGLGTPAYRFHRAPLADEYEIDFTFEDITEKSTELDFYYIRVRQKNDQWAWSSPVWIQ